MSEKSMELQSAASMEIKTSTSTSDYTDPCPICLGPINQSSYLDNDPFGNNPLHVTVSTDELRITLFSFYSEILAFSFSPNYQDNFCYNCIVQWTKVVSGKRSCRLSSIKCPLCKTESSSIIHGLDGHHFQRHYVNPDFQDSFILSKAHKYRLQCYYTEPGRFLNDIFDVQRYWKLQKYLQANQWLEVWLKRELQALIQEEDVDIIMHHFVGLINSFFRRNEPKYQTETPELKRKRFSQTILDAAKPFLSARADRFMLELELFLASGLNIEAYDSVYLQRLGWNEPIVLSVANEEDLGLKSVTPYLYIFDNDPDDD
ncbi:RING zinc finger protein-like protein [Cucumis melo var. makuwa]|uniref:RING zinc finger protein-like protein n=2 Tax=Cucumis melo TaxID=3656 RepID=A0A5A7U2Q2_CUCMM|nr:RING zinc finger protein-like protein [Cucumis melo var. makuwa]